MNFSHWSNKYVGKVYVAEEYDCGEMVREVQIQEFHRTVLIPTERSYRGKQGREKLRETARQILLERDRVAVRTETPVDGDAVLMFSGSKAMHVGVYCLINGEAWVLHCAERVAQVIRTRVRELDPRGFRLEGYYKWK
jgi:hypothetical protein